MPNDLLASVDYGGYVSAWKLVLFVVGFFGWLPLVNWVYVDTQAVRTNTLTWTLAVLGAGFTSLLIWLLIPVFFIGLLIYLIATSCVMAAYIMNRNARVADFEKVLTPDHLRGLFTNPTKKIEEASHHTASVLSPPTATKCRFRNPRAKNWKALSPPVI